ncbi:LysE family transporter [Uliginosibacterium gangwonense]|uniref:LysE family transporter n=1 Tax=Uliginosibacterium gangwonense TaxID=392736 RepID=UPI000368BF00|nr:LysE family transporter [Uliginosibacterium gangwonense]
MGLHTWLAFFVAAWLISLSPGPGALSCMTAGMRHGFWHATWNIVGLELGVALLVAVVATGLGTVLSASLLVFSIIKWGGVAYLVYLGVCQWRAAPVPVVDASQGMPDTATRRELLMRAFLINASNPKGILFMLAVLPQFIDSHQAQAPQYLICLATLLFTDIVVMCGYTLLAVRVLHVLRDPGHLRWVNRCFGGLFVGAGALLAEFRR